MKKLGLPVAIILILSLFAGIVLVAPLVPIAHAANPVINMTVTCTSSNVHTCVTSSLTITTSGDIIVLMIGFQNVGTQDASPITSITDTQGLTYSAQAACTQIHDTLNSRFLGSCVYTATTTSTTADTITITYAQSTNYFSGGSALDVSNLGGPLAEAGSAQTGSCTTNGTCSQSPTTSSSSSFTYSSGQLPVAVLGSDAGGTCGGGTNYQSVLSSQADGCSAYAKSSAASPTNFPLSMTVANDWIDTGVVIGQAATVTLPLACTLTGGPNFPSGLSPQSLTITGGSPAPSPSTANCSTAGTTTNLTVQLSTTITATAPGCTAQYCFYFQSGNTWTTTATKLSCAVAGSTCPTWTLTLFALSPAGPPILGNCPGTKNNTQITLANNTVYTSSTILATTGQNLGGQGINTINSFEIAVASVSSTTAQEPLYWGLYLTPGPGTVSGGNPMGLIGSGSVVLSPGTKNAVIQTYGFINYFSSFSGGSIVLALEGNSKIVLNGSQPKFASFGTPQPTLPAFSTTSGSTLKIGLFACALFYTVPQEVTTTTVSTTTSTSTSTSFGQTVTTTTTNSINAPTPTGNWIVPMYFLVIPTSLALAMGIIIEARGRSHR